MAQTYEFEVKMKVRVWGSNENHAWQRMKLLNGENACRYLGAGESAGPIFKVLEIERTQDGNVQGQNQAVHR